MRIASLGSGSRGNATLIGEGDTLLLVDCGFPLREIERRLGLLGVEPAALTAILVTHEHGDHIGGVGPLARRHRLPVYMTAGTALSGRCGALPRFHRLDCDGPELRFGPLRVAPFPVPHDAREPVQFVVTGDATRLGILTDVGMPTPFIRERLQGCDGLVLECNHDLELLAAGPYPPALQARIAGRLGHLSNDQALALLTELTHAGLRRLFLAHLSEKNNCPERLTGLLARRLPDFPGVIERFEQDRVSGWHLL